MTEMPVIADPVARPFPGIGATYSQAGGGKIRGTDIMIQRMTKKKYLPVVFAAAALLALLQVFFEVSIDPQFALPTEIETPDPAQEARFTVCFEMGDATIHERAFATIDNPDVQREFITAERAKASAACRETYPELLQAEQLPLRIKLLELRYRY